MSKNNNFLSELTVVQPQAVPIATMLCRTARIGDIVNRMVNWNEANAKISPGMLIESLVVCIICGRKPLWRVEEFWAKQDLKLLFDGVDVTLDQLNDDAYGRALDKLSEVKMEELVNSCALQMITYHGLDISTIHLDTTSKSVQGAYDNEPHGAFIIERGHSKDHRPDLKQFKIGAANQQNGLPVMGEMLAGNKSDMEWNPDAVLKMSTFFEKKGFRDIVFVSDCVLVHGDSLSQLAKSHLQFISRLPETFKLAQELKDLAWQSDNWHDIGILADPKSKKAAYYKTFAVNSELNGREYDFVVVHSSALEASKEKSLKRRITKQHEELEKQANELSGQEFACEPDALSALNTFKDTVINKGFDFQGAVEHDQKRSYSHQGRPRKNEQPVVKDIYHAVCSVGEIGQDFYTHLMEKESTFILIANVHDKKKYDDRGILEEYKHQISIENKFRFLKNPVYLGPVFLENQNRIDALGYLFILVLLIGSYLEYRVRKSLKKTGQALIQPGNKKNVRPSTMTIIEVLNFITVAIFSGQRVFPQNCNQQALSMVTWAGFDPADVYLRPLPWYVTKKKKEKW
jgi:transposase